MRNRVKVNKENSRQKLHRTKTHLLHQRAAGQLWLSNQLAEQLFIFLKPI
jgi:hypothetical protein